MIPFRFRLIVTAALALALAGSLSAQTSNRSSNTTRSSSSTNRSSSGRSSSGGYGNSMNGSTRQYPSNTLIGDAVIQIDPESRSLIVVTDEATHKEIEKVVDNLDHPKPQVLIKVLFIEVSLDKGLDVGVEGNYTFKVGNGGLLSSTTSSIQTLLGLSPQATGTFAGTFARITADDWSATLTALATHDKIRILSRPTIMARNNQEAVIVVGKEVPFITNSQITSTGQTINTVQYQDVGIILRVTPFISSDKSIEMIVAPEISEIAPETVAIGNNVRVPVINKRSAETVVVTPNGTTVVIGGMMQTTTKSNVQKIPLLGDIPVLGFPFRHTIKSESRSELLIFLTPYVVENPRTLKAMTDCAVNPEDLKRNGFPADEILKDIEDFKLPCAPDPKSASTPAPQKAPRAKAVSAKQ